MSLGATLLDELKALRAGTGLTETRLSAQPSLLRHVGGSPTRETLKNLALLVNEISDYEQRTAVRYAFGLEGGSTRQTKERREAALNVLSMSARTLDRREIDGLRDVARLIIERSTELTDRERLAEIDATTSIANRLSDLEAVIYGMVRYDALTKAWMSNPDQNDAAFQLRRLEWKSDEWLRAVHRLSLLVAPEAESRLIMRAINRPATEAD